MTSVFSLLRPLLFMLPAETAHGLTIAALKKGWVPTPRPLKTNAVLTTQVFGLTFKNPVGLAAGFDKNGAVMDEMLALGFGWVEAGTVTPRPQAGNPKPRLFRLRGDRAIINRLGFNNKGLDAFGDAMGRRKNAAAAGEVGGVVGANIGANKDSIDRIVDYVTGVRRLNGLVDYFTVNISSPNTPGLRALQHKDALSDLLTEVMAARDEGPRTPILLKIAPDLTTGDKRDIAEVCTTLAVDGLIVGNTTVSRPSTLKDENRREKGGLSGAPLLPLANQTLFDMYHLTKGRIPLVGVGGVACGADAYAKVRAGASLLQLYSMMVFEGPGLAQRVCAELSALLKRDGFNSIQQAVGADHR